MASSSHPVLHHFLRPPSIPISSSSFSCSCLLSVVLFKPFTAERLHTPLLRSTACSSASFSPVPLLFLSSSLSLSSHKLHLYPPPRSLSTSQPTLEPQIEDICDESNEEGEEFEIGNEDFELEEEEEETAVHPPDRVLNSPPSTTGKESAAKLPTLTVKEKKELASYAHSLGKKLKSQQVGKWGVTDSVATALIETLGANELLKIKIQKSCPGELDDVVNQLEKATGSVAVGQVGRTLILYKPSLAKLKAEEKKKQVLTQRTFRAKQLTLKPMSKPSFQNKDQLPRLSGRGRRGSRRFLSSP
ncbi:hypothetical protein U1Q18_034800 [Sarracenia purpurea var. burkii]